MNRKFSRRKYGQPHPVIRSYFLYRNQVVDHRTGTKAEPDNVLNGNLEPFIRAELHRRVT